MNNNDNDGVFAIGMVLGSVIAVFIFILMDILFGQTYADGQQAMWEGKAHYQYVTTADGGQQLLRTNEFEVQCEVKE